MWGAVNEGGGTGARAHDPGLDIAGKTGTAQVVSDELQKSARKAEYKNNAWFVGYAPSAKPEIVVSVLVMQGEHSTVAVPIARDVIKAYFQKKAWRRPPAGQLQTQVREMSQVLGTTPSEAGPAPQDR
jgi:penicillin-binding protein 2